MLAFLQEFYGRKLTGYRLIRYTNFASGFPVYRVDLFQKSELTPNEAIFTGQKGDNIDFGNRKKIIYSEGYLGNYYFPGDDED